MHCFFFPQEEWVVSVVQLLSLVFKDYVSVIFFINYFKKFDLYKMEEQRAELKDKKQNNSWHD